MIAEVYEQQAWSMFMDAQDFLNHLAGWIQVLVQWVIVPLTMIWLAGRWFFLDFASVTADPKEVELLKKRRRTGWITGFLFAIIIFAAGAVPGNPQAAALWQPVKYPQYASCVWAVAVIAGGVLVLPPRPSWVWIRGHAELGLSAFLACGIGAFSLLSYFLWPECQGLLAAGFIGLLLGYRLARLIEVSLW